MKKMLLLIAILTIHTSAVADLFIGNYPHRLHPRNVKIKNATKSELNIWPEVKLASFSEFSKKRINIVKKDYNIQKILKKKKTNNIPVLAHPQLPSLVALEFKPVKKLSLLTKKYDIKKIAKFNSINIQKKHNNHQNQKNKKNSNSLVQYIDELIRLGDKEKAKNNYKKALEYYKKAADKGLTIDYHKPLLKKAEIYIQQKNYNRAKLDLLIAETTIKTKKLYKMLLECLKKENSNIYKQYYKKAHEAFPNEFP